MKKKIKDNLYQRKKLKIIKYTNEITNDINFNESNVQYNTPILIEYKTFNYKLNTREYYDKCEATWKCINNRKLKDKPKELKKYCDSTIKGFRAPTSNKYFKFYLIKLHTDLCIKNQNNINKIINEKFNQNNDVNNVYEN